MEVFCGGLNSKTPTAAAVWRQGNLLHFGFAPSPACLNRTGRALLVNAVAYISRFRDDRPIPRTASPFEGIAAVARSRSDRLLQQPHPDPDAVNYYFSREAQAAGNAKDTAAFKKWYSRNRPFLRADPKTGHLVLDEEAKGFGVAPATPDFLGKAVAAMQKEGPAAEKARRLLRRYAPEGPASADAAAWARWCAENRPYLFFSDSGGYRWYVDPLAKNRKVPTAQLRGPARASRR